MSRVERVKEQYVAGEISDLELDAAIEAALEKDRTCGRCGEWSDISPCIVCRSRDTESPSPRETPIFSGQRVSKGKRRKRSAAQAANSSDFESTGQVMQRLHNSGGDMIDELQSDSESSDK